MKHVVKLLIAGLLLPGFVSAQNTGDENQFSISTQLRPRGEYRNGVIYPRPEGETSTGFITNRARISMEYKRNDDLTMKFSAQHVGVWGEDPQIDKNGRFMLNEAWARLNLGKGFFGQLGRQQLSYDDDRILGTLDWNVSGRYHDALKLGYENEFNRLHLILAFNQNNDSRTFGGTYYAPGGQPYKNMQTLWYNVYSSEYPFSASFLAMNLGREGGNMQDQESDTKYLQTFGTHLNYNPSDWNLTGTFYYQTGKTTGDSKVSAFMASLRAGYKFTREFSAFVASDYLSGSKAGDDKTKAFDPLYGTHHKFYGAMDYFYASGIIAPFNPGLWDNQLGLAYKASPKVDLSLNYHYFLTAQKLKINDAEYKKGLGSEIDFQLDWSIMKDVKLSAGYSVMFGTETMDILKGGNHKSWQDWGWVSININPKILSVRW